MVSARLLGYKESVVCVRMVNVSYVIKVLWKMLCISCCTEERLAGDRKRLLGVIEGIGGPEEWMAEWRNKGDEGRVGLFG